jgi:AcrR family transcriptional regulator
VSEPACIPPLGRREARTATSRARILDAAVACLVESGYSGATTLQIQARAGVSRGRLLHHFPSRDELLVAASRHLATERLRATAARIGGLARGLTGGDRLDRAVELMWETFSEPHFWAAIELWTAARTNPELQRALLPEEREVGAAIRAAADAFYGPRLVGHPALPAGARPDPHEHAGRRPDLRVRPARSPHRPAPVAVEGARPHVAGVASGTVTNGIDPAATPSGTGCVECDDAGGWWVHLRRCAQCGHVGCCDSSPAQHATAHAAASGHPVVQSFEPGEDWFWDYERGTGLTGPELAAPTHRPLDQPVPGPAGRVPADWQQHIH